MEKPVYQKLDTALMVAATTFITLFAKNAKTDFTTVIVALNVENV